MVVVRGREKVRTFMAQLPAQIESKLLPGAARAAAKVVAEEAKARSISNEVADAVQLSRTKREGGRLSIRVQVKGAGAYLAPWLEYGTDPHFISVADSDRRGMTVRRINKLEREGSLVIGGKFVGPSVFHPGARPHPFLRPALDTKEGEAVAAAQSYINARLARARGAGLASLGDEE